MNSNKTKLIYQILAFVIPFIAYVITLAPTVTFIDAGELTTVCAKLGVAHPTGYPLFTVIGHLFSLLPTGSVVYSLNLMCAVISSVTVVIFFNLLVFIFSKLKLSEVSLKPLDETVIHNISLAASLTLAFSKTFWDTANAIEVYSLHTFFIVINIFLFLKACNVTVEDTKENVSVREKYWFLWAFVLGLSFTNHLSTIFLSVGILATYLLVAGINPTSLKRIGFMAIPFLLGLSVYIYLPIRADNTVLSWGHPDTWDNFFRHVSGKQFSVWMFTGSGVMREKISYFLENFLSQFFYMPLSASYFFLGLIFSLLIMLIGVIETCIRNAKLFLLTILLFLFCVLYASNYDIHDIDSYFLLAFITAAIWIGFFFHFVIRVIDEKKRIGLSYILIAFALIPFYSNHTLVDESKNYFVKDYTFNIFNSAPQNSIIVSTQWDFWLSASIYFQYVEGIRKDLVIIDKELLRKTWYIPHIKEHYPEIYTNSKAEFDSYYNELLKFEKNSERYTKPTTEADRQDLMKIQTYFKELLTSLIEKNPDRNFFTTFEIESEKNERFGNSFARIPEGMLIRYIKPSPDYDNYVMPEMKYTITEETDYYHTFIMNAYYNAYMSRANYLMNFAKYDEAEVLINKATLVNPKGPEIKLLQNKIKQLRTVPGK